MQSGPAVANAYSGSGTNRRFFLPRLAPSFYQGDAVIHWTMPVAMRASGWLNEAFHAKFRETMLHTAFREGLFCPVYCLMPDHIHLLWMGLRCASDQRKGVKFLREHLRHCDLIVFNISPTTMFCAMKSGSATPSPKSAFTCWPIRFALA